MIEPPSSLEASTVDMSKEEPPNAPQSQAPPNRDEPQKCWICFADETEDTPLSSEWVSPCPCTLKAHQNCLLDWIADLQSPKRRKAKKVECPQCKADIKVSQPPSLSIELVRATQRITGVLIWPMAGLAVGATVAAGLFLHGYVTTGVLLGRAGLDKLMPLTFSKQPWGRLLAMPCIPIVLILSRTNTGDSVLPLLPILYLSTHKDLRKLKYPYSPSLWLTALPMIRGLYFGAYRRFALPREKAWLQGIQPRAAEAAEEGDAPPADENDEEGQDGGPLDMDFELGVQIEVEAVEEDAEHHHHHHHHHILQIEEEVVEPAPANQDAENPEQDVPQNENNGNEEQDQNEGQGQNEPAPPPQQPQQPQQRPIPRQPIIQNFFFAIPGLTRMSLGALCFPFVSYYMGQILKGTLPKTWVTRPGYWERRREGILQSRIGRTLVGGCLFVVLKDAFFFYSKYRMAQNHKKRKVLNYNEIRKPWYQKNVEELVFGK